MQFTVLGLCDYKGVGFSSHKLRFVDFFFPLLIGISEIHGVETSGGVLKGVEPNTLREFILSI